MTLQLAEKVAAWVRAHYPESTAVPVNLPRLAYSLGIGSISYTRLFEDGRLETDGTTARILVRDSTAPARQRFTIAHELGHQLLTRPGQAAVERRLATDNDVERFCDQFAAALLMPREWVANSLAGSPMVLSTVRDLSSSTGTSLAASVVRLQQVLGWSQMLMHWKLTEGNWRYRWGAGVPSTLQGQVRALPATYEAFESVRRRTSGDVEMDLPLQVQGEHRALRAILSCRGGSALALVDYRRWVAPAGRDGSPHRG